MKTLKLFLTIFTFSLTTFSQTQMFIHKYDGTCDSVFLHEIKNITFKISNIPPGPPQLVYGKYVESASKIFISDLDGTNELQLTSGTTNEWQPKFNASRTKIVFTSDRDGQADVYTMNIDGSSVTKITTTGTWGGHNQSGSAAWTIDDKILFTSGDKLYKIDSDGNNQTVIYTAPEGRGIHSVLTSQIFTKAVVQIQGSWGYDLEHIVMNADGSEDTMVVPNEAGGTSLGGFSPDGNKLLFSWDTTGHEDGSGAGLEHHIYMLNLTNGTKTDLSGGKLAGTLDIHPTFTRDGNKVLFVNHDPTALVQNSLWIMNSDGSQRIKIMDNVSWLSDSR